MPRSIVFATANSNKVREVREILGSDIELIGLKEIGCTEDVPETQPTIEGNALQKARYIVDNYGVNCFAEDTGLEIAALDGEPGVRSARYAGEARSDAANMALVLERLSDKTDRSARFKTVVALILDGETHCFEGIANGRIATEKTGDAGFGYDPIFIPEGADKSFAAMTAAEKHKFSHRAKAIKKLERFLKANTRQGEI